MPGNYLPIETQMGWFLLIEAIAKLSHSALWIIVTFLFNNYYNYYNTENFRIKLDDFNNRRNELLSELSEFHLTKKFIEETQKTISDLNDEKDVHSEMIQQINMVLNYFYKNSRI